MILNGLVRRLIIPENLSYFFVLDGEFLQELFDRLREIKSGIKPNFTNKHTERHFIYGGDDALSEIEKNRT